MHEGPIVQNSASQTVASQTLYCQGFAGMLNALFYIGG